MSSVNHYLSCRGVNKQVSNGWWSSFCKRHPGLVLRTSASLSRSRYQATNQGMLDSYFSLLQKHREDLINQVRFLIWTSLVCLLILGPSNHQSVGCEKSKCKNSSAKIQQVCTDKSIHCLSKNGKKLSVDEECSNLCKLFQPPSSNDQEGLIGRHRWIVNGSEQ